MRLRFLALIPAPTAPIAPLGATRRQVSLVNITGCICSHGDHLATIWHWTDKRIRTERQHGDPGCDQSSTLSTHVELSNPAIKLPSIYPFATDRCPWPTTLWWDAADGTTNVLLTVSNAAAVAVRTTPVIGSSTIHHISARDAHVVPAGASTSATAAPATAATATAGSPAVSYGR